jgi:hypothetical protein
MRIVDEIKYWLSELSGVWSILLFAIVVSLLSWGISELFGKKYEKFYANKHSYSWAITQYKSVCEQSSSHEDEEGVEYYKFYDSRSQAINDFMTLARMFDGKYANGKFRHLYLRKDERIYQCWDRNKKLIAIHFVKHKAGFYFGSWQKSSYEIEFYVEK